MKTNQSEAEPYVKALFELISDNSLVLKQSLEILLSIENISEHNTDFLAVLSNPTLRSDLKLSILNKLFPQISELKDLDKLIQLMIKKKKAHLIPALGNLLKRVMLEKDNIDEVQIISSHELSAAQIDNLKVFLGQFLNKQIQIKSKIDKSLIGGLIIQTENYIFDNSLKSRLNSMKEKILSS
jgi:F-type H+-transporting ATPase subunit delta